MKLKSNLLPRTKEWCRIEITHEEKEEDGKYYTSFSINGKDSERKEVGFMQEIIDGIKVILCGGRVPPEALQPGLIRGLVVLKKEFNKTTMLQP